jgi:hypothetical protein
MSEQKRFHDFDGAVDYIISRLDNSERELIENADPAGLHMALDRWIKNEYVFSETTNINELIYDKVKKEDPYYRDNPDEQLKIHPDNLSGIIIDGLIEKLQK